MKQRLVGALVLLCGGVVLWSVLFTGPAAYKVDRATQIPSAPSIDEPDPIQPRRPEGVAEVREPAPMPEPPVPDIADAGESDGQTKAAAPGEQEPAKAEPKREAPLVDAEKAMPNAWVIQVASFSSVDNANKMKARLQQKGYKAYVEAAPNSSGKVLQRVLVGPELKRERAESQKKAIESTFGLKALLHKFEP